MKVGLEQISSESIFFLFKTLYSPAPELLTPLGQKAKAQGSFLFHGCWPWNRAKSTGNAHTTRAHRFIGYTQEKRLRNQRRRKRKKGSKQKRMTVWDLCKWRWLEEEGENLLENSVGKVILEICIEVYSWASWNKIASGRKAISSIHLITYMLPYRLKSIKVHHYLGNITTSSREKTQHFHNYLLSYHYVS